MRPADLTNEHFSRYPADSRALCTDHLTVLRQLPISFLPGLLREIIDYGDSFPAERTAVDRQLTLLQSLSAKDVHEWFRAFAEIQVSGALEKQDWINQPASFLQDLSAHLWATHQMDSFRAAAEAYGNRIQALAKDLLLPAVPRLGVAVIGQGVASYEGRLFEKLRPHGTLFSNVAPQDGLRHILAAMETRAKAHERPYAHWYIDGGVAEGHDASLVLVSYTALGDPKRRLLQYIEREASKPGMGPEQLRAGLMRLAPKDLGMEGDPVLSRFKMKILTEGSGTQIFSTTFAQWAAREALRRAQAITLLVRYAPRQRDRPMQELLSAAPGVEATDPIGSLIDADMGAYYQWIDQQRLPGADKSIFVAWFENHNKAVVISPLMPRDTESRSPVDLAKLLQLSLA